MSEGKEKNGVVYNLRDGFTVEEIPPDVIGEFEPNQKGFRKGFVKIQPANQVKRGHLR